MRNDKGAEALDEPQNSAGIGAPVRPLYNQAPRSQGLLLSPECRYSRTLLPGVRRAAVFPPLIDLRRDRCAGAVVVAPAPFGCEDAPIAEA